MLKYACVAAFLATILTANYATTELGMVSVGFGLTATAGTYLAGLSFIFRDSLQDAIRASLTIQGRTWWGLPVSIHPSDLQVATRVLAVIAAGAALSFIVSAPVIAVASAAAFACSEVCDYLVYTPLRRRGYLRAAIASNVVGTFVDTFVFLSVAGFPMAAWQGQALGKLTVTAVAAGLVVLHRRARAARLAVA